MCQNHRFILLGIIILGVSCTFEKPIAKGKGEDPDKRPGSEPNTDAIVGTSTSTNSGDGAIKIPNYPELYCKHIQRVKLRTDVSQELGQLCQNETPTELLLNSRDQALSSEVGQYSFRMLNETENKESELSEFTLIWSFRLNIRPFEVKAKPFYEYIVKGFKSEFMELKSTFEVHPKNTLDSGLHLWSVGVKYDLSLNAAENLKLANVRNTEYNLYQVQSGNEEMGFGLEHLTIPDPENFTLYKFLNLAMNDGKGYNDGDGKTVIIGYLHLAINNQGYHEIAKKAVLEIATKAVEHLRDGLVQ